MSCDPQSNRDWTAFRVDVAVGARRLDASIEVPAGPTPLGRLLPIIQGVADVVVAKGIEESETSGRPVSCHRGCGACCRQLVPLAPVEAIELARLVGEMPADRQARIRARFADARRRLAEAGLLKKLEARDLWPVEADVEVGSQYFYLGLACPFLEEEACSVYADRPVACREFLVTSPPERCSHPDKEPIERVDLAVQVSAALGKLDAQTNPQDSDWVPLILALDWALSHQAPPVEKPGDVWLRNFFTNLSGQPSSADGPPQA